MSKSSTYGKKPISSRTDRDDAADAPLYGHVTALNAMENAAEHTMKAASSPAFMPTTDSESSMKTASFSTTPVEISPLAAIVPSAITYPSTNISKVYQHWADGDAARASAPEWNNNILSDSKSDYFEGEVVPHAYFYKASNNIKGYEAAGATAAYTPAPAAETPAWPTAEQEAAKPKAPAWARK